MTDPQQPQSLPPKLELWEGSSAYVNQGRHWSSAIIWLSSSLFGIALVWAFTAKIDQTISVRGRLEPSGSVREVDAPSSGVVADVLVKEGEIVQAGQPLFTVEAQGLASRRKALQATLELLQVQANRSRPCWSATVIHHASVLNHRCPWSPIRSCGPN